MPTSTLNGSCACHLTTYTSTSSNPPLHLDFCYCTTCRFISGAPFMAWMGIEKSSLTVSGPFTIISLSTVAKRTICSKCGSNLILQYDCYSHKTHVAAATVQKSEWELPEVGVHIFVRSCPGWYRIPDDGVVRWEEFDAEFEGKFSDVVERLRVEG